MTTIRRVTTKEMERRTGLPQALGYTFPEKNEILLHKDLKGEAKKEVLAHEVEHLENGEEGPFLPILGGIISAVSSVGGLLAQKSAADDARNIAKSNLDYQKRKDAPALEQREYLGDVLSGRVDPTQALESSPGYQFRMSEGNKALDRFLSKRGGPGRLGGAALKAGMQYGQNFASNEWSNFLNNRFRLAGMSGDVGGAYQGQANAATNQGDAVAGGLAGVNQALQSGLTQYQAYRTANQPSTTGYQPSNTSYNVGPYAGGYRMG